MLNSLPEDEHMGDIKPQRIRLDSSLYENPIDIKEPADSVKIFQDLDVISGRKRRDEVYKILNKVLEIGRQHRINCLCTNHLPTSGKDTRRILNEAHQVVYIPRSASSRIEYLLTDNLGLDKKQVA